MNTTTTMSATMQATVCNVERNQLLVCDHATQQEVVVHTDQACCFHVGDCICIHYNGIMTASIPHRSAPTVSMSFAGAAAEQTG